MSPSERPCIYTKFDSDLLLLGSYEYIVDPEKSSQVKIKARLERSWLYLEYRILGALVLLRDFPCTVLPNLRFCTTNSTGCILSLLPTAMGNLMKCQTHANVRQKPTFRVKCSL